jgi:hypothetical protein
MKPCEAKEQRLKRRGQAAFAAVGGGGLEPLDACPAVIDSG